jgi:hypothetical protein
MGGKSDDQTHPKKLDPPDPVDYFRQATLTDWANEMFCPFMEQTYSSGLDNFFVKFLA